MINKKVKAGEVYSEAVETLLKAIKDREVEEKHTTVKIDSKKGGGSGTGTGTISEVKTIKKIIPGNVDLAIKVLNGEIRLDGEYVFEEFCKSKDLTKEKLITAFRTYPKAVVPKVCGMKKHELTEFIEKDEGLLLFCKQEKYIN